MKLHRHLGHLLQRGVAHQTQADAGDDGARPRAPAQRVDPARRRLSRRRAKRRQARSWRAGKTPFVAAVETNEQGHPLRMKLTVGGGLPSHRNRRLAQLHLVQALGRLRWAGLLSWRHRAGCVHEPVVVGTGRAAVERPEFRWVNTILGNIKNALRGTYHAIRPKYAQRYLSEFEYRFQSSLRLA